MTDKIIIKKNFIKKIIVVFAVGLLISGCSRVDWKHEYSNVNGPEKHSYTKTCNNGSFKILMYDYFCFRMTGLPYIPIFPLPLSLSSDVRIIVEPEYDSTYTITDLPKIAIRKKGSNILIKPVRIDTSGRKSYLQYYLDFDEGFNSSDTIEVVFMKEYNGCELLPISFTRYTVRDYSPIEFPAH